VHGSPERNDEPLMLDTPEERLSDLAKQVDTDVVLCGHSHRYFARQAQGKWFVNPGSVGRPFDGDPRASYAVIEVKEGKMAIQNRRIAYPVEETTGKMREYGFPQALIESIATGLSLDDLKIVPADRNDTEIMSRILKIAESCRYEKAHAQQVTNLALQIFDQLQELHGLGEKERLWLQVAGLLHDIGWVKGQEGHHKAGRDIILSDPDFPLTGEAQTVIALLVRYHRRGVPKDSQRYFCDLNAEMKTAVRKLAAILRIADGLDRSHGSLVQELACEISPEKVTVKLKCGSACELEQEGAKEKADLFSEIFGREIVFLRG
jgi:diadenosine tetraphosphatase ApaH/serine/threonine PP2A family protein phosphatase